MRRGRGKQIYSVVIHALFWVTVPWRLSSPHLTLSACSSAEWDPVEKRSVFSAPKGHILKILVSVHGLPRLMSQDGFRSPACNRDRFLEAIHAWLAQGYIGKLKLSNSF